jgi:hypothetical protein
MEPEMPPYFKYTTNLSINNITGEDNNPAIYDHLELGTDDDEEASYGFGFVHWSLDLKLDVKTMKVGKRRCRFWDFNSTREASY